MSCREGVAGPFDDFEDIQSLSPTSKSIAKEQDTTGAIFLLSGPSDDSEDIQSCTLASKMLAQEISATNTTMAKLTQQGKKIDQGVVRQAQILVVNDLGDEILRTELANNMFAYKVQLGEGLQAAQALTSNPKVHPTDRTKLATNILAMGEKSKGILVAAKELVVNLKADAIARTALASEMFMQKLQLEKPEIDAAHRLIDNPEGDVRARTALATNIAAAGLLQVTPQRMAILQELLESPKVNVTDQTKLAINLFVSDLQLAQLEPIVQITRKFIGKQVVDKTYRTKLAISMLRKQADLGQASIEEAQRLVVDHSVNATLRIKLWRHLFFQEDLQLGQLEINAAHAWIDNPEVDINKRADLATNMTFKELLQFTPQRLVVLQELLASPEVDVTLRTKLAGNLFMSNLQLAQLEPMVEIARNFIGEQAVDATNRTKLAINMLRKQADLGQAGMNDAQDLIEDNSVSAELRTTLWELVLLRGNLHMGQQGSTQVPAAAA